MADLSIGSDATGFERFGACEYNDIKNHWRMADPRGTLTDEQAGMIVSDSDDDRLYHYGSSGWRDIWTPDAPYPWANLLINSPYGVWSRSDVNKGIAALVFDNGTAAPVVGETIAGADGTGKVIWVDVTNNDWAGGNGAGTCYLGAVTGAYIDNETIVGSGAASFDVNGDNSIGVTNDPMNNDSTGEWTDDGANIALAFAAAEYTVTTNAANQRAWMTNCAFTAGKLYKIEIDIKDGTQAGVDIELYFNDGAAQYGKVETTAAGWASIWYTFECATTTAAGLAGFRIVDNCGGNNIEVRYFSCYEITPCCTAADAVACDWWDKATTCDIYRQHDDATYTRDGSFYSLRVVPTSTTEYNLLFPKSEFYIEPHLSNVANRTVAFGAWIYASAASHVRLVLRDGIAANEHSEYHTGTPGWEWLEVPMTIASNATRPALASIQTSVAGNIDGSTIFYVSQPMLVFGASIGAGNYRPRQQELIWCEAYITGKEYDGESGLSNVAFTSLNIEADSDGRIPKGCRAVWMYVSCRDSGSAANPCYVQFRANATIRPNFVVSLTGLANDSYIRLFSPQACDENGDIEYEINASGAGTLDFNAAGYGFLYKAIQTN